MKLHFYTTMMLSLVTSNLCAAATHESLTADNTTIIENLGLSRVITAQRLEAIIDEADIQSQMIIDPIYIGGARYQLNRSNLIRTETDLFGEGIILMTSYTASIPVYGDSGQDLFFDIFGNTNAVDLRFNARCGTYQDSDVGVGSKYVMSKVVNTNGSCQTMKVQFLTFGREDISSINLTILISEQI